MPTNSNQADLQCLKSETFIYDHNQLKLCIAEYVAHSKGKAKSKQSAMDILSSNNLICAT